MTFRNRQKVTDTSGFTLVELMIVIAIIGILASIAVPAINHYIYRAKVARTIFELKTIEASLMSYMMTHNEFPPDLQTVGFADIIDSWGNPYVYTRADGTPQGKLRKNKFLVPVNTDFDLYSKGKDGKTKNPFTVPVSKDDIVRANNGGYFGLVSRY